MKIYIRRSCITNKITGVFDYGDVELRSETLVPFLVESLAQPAVPAPLPMAVEVRGMLSNGVEIPLSVRGVYELRDGKTGVFVTMPDAAQPAVQGKLGDRFMEILRVIHGDMPDSFADSARLAFVHATQEAQPAAPKHDPMLPGWLAITDAAEAIHKSPACGPAECQAFCDAVDRLNDALAQPAVPLAAMEALRQLADAMEYHIAQTRPITSSVVCLDNARTVLAQSPREPLSFSDEDIRKGVRAFQSGHNGFDDLSDWRAFLSAVLAAQEQKP